MKINDYPKTLPLQQQYTAGEIAVLYGVSHRTAAKMIDAGSIKGFTLPGSRERRVLFSDLVTHIEANPQFSYVLTKIEGYATPVARICKELIS